ncbi:MAG: hypothetical protein ACREBC_17085 [Pyrinomonadaceae bacterium]
MLGCISQFLLWRKLPDNIANKRFRKAVIETHVALGQPQPQFSEQTVWGALDTLNQLRNEIVHHKAQDLTRNGRIVAIIDGLTKGGVISRSDPSPTWEERVLIPSVAVWAHNAVGRAIITLETFEHGRARPLELVRHAVERAINGLDELV